MTTSCKVFQDVNIPFLSSGIVLAVGIFLSYVPQHVKIIKRRSSEGLSPTFLLLGSLSAFSASLNIYIVTIPARNCCYIQLTKLQCLNSLVGMIQIFFQSAGYILIFFLCTFFTRNSIRESQISQQKLKIDFNILILYVVINLVFLFYLLNLKKNKDVLSLFADISGVISTFLAIIQYIPQLFTTYKIKHAGSLSIPMMLLQTPGGYIWSLSLFLQPNSKWSSWLPYFAAANLQLVLLLMCVYFNIHYPTKLIEANAELRIAEENIANSSHSINESTSLI